MANNKFDSASLVLIPSGKKVGKVYCQKPHTGAGDFNFSRASTAGYFDEAGNYQIAAINEPRFEWVNGRCYLLLDPTRQNLFLNTLALATQDVTLTAATYALSFYGTGSVKNENTGVTLVGTGAGQRVILIFTGVAALVTFTVTGTVTLANMELGNSATSPIATEGTTVTRAAEILTLSAATALIGQTEGTIFVEVLYDASVENRAPNAGQPLLTVGTDINNSTYILLKGGNDGFYSNKVVGVTVNGGVTQAIIASAAQVSGVIKIAYPYAAGSFKLFANGAKLGEDLSGTVPAGGNIFFGNFSAAGALFTMRLSSSIVYKIALSDDDSILITSI